MPMTTLPAAPSTSSPSDFATKADALLAALPTFVTEANALETAVDADKTAAAGSAIATAADAIATAADRVQTGLDVTASAASAAAAAGSASTSAGWKATSTTSMAIGTGAKSLTIQTGKQFVGGTDIKVTRTSAPTTTYVTATVDTYNSGTGALAFTVPTGGTAGSGTYTDWTVALSGPTGATGATGATGTGITNQTVGFTATGGTTPATLTVDVDVTVSDLFSKITRVPRTSNTILGAADKGKLIDVTTASFTQTFDAAATLGSGWFAQFTNSSATDLTFDANASETIGAVNAATTAVLKPGQSVTVISDGSNLYFADQPTGFRNMEVFTSSGTFTPKPGVTRYFIRMKAAGGGGYGLSATGTAPGGAEGGEVSGFVNITSAQTVTIGAGGTGGTSGVGTAGGDSTFGALATANGGLGGQAAPTGSLGGSGTFSGGLVERGAPNMAVTGLSFLPGAGRGGGVAAGEAGVNGAGGAGNVSGVAAGAGGDGFCIVMW